MRLTIALLAAAILSQPLFAAPKKSAFEAKFLTFSQLAALPQAKRDQYVQDVVRLIITMERANSHYEIADNGMSLEELKYKFATLQQWLRFLPEAEARNYQRTNQTASGVMTWDGNAFTCGQGYEVDLSIPGCLKVNVDGSTMFNEFAREHGGCDGMQAITHPDPFAPAGSKACMTVQGFNKLGKLRREALKDEKKDAFLDPVAFQRQTHEQQMEIAYGANSDSDTSQVNSSPAGTAGAGAPAAPQASSSAPAASAPSAPDAATPAPAPTPAPVTPAAAAGAGPAAITPPSVSAKPTVVPQPEKPDLSEEDPNADQCLPEATTCDDPNDAGAKKKRDEAIARFRKTPTFKGLDANICIVGGFPSKYESARKDAGTCKPVYKWGPAQCKQNQVLCNPVLFCHTLENSKGKPVPRFLCVDKKDTVGQSNPQWTAACAAELKKRLAPGYLEELTYKVTNPKTKKVTWVKKKADKPLKACSPADMKVGGVQEEWDKMAAGLEKLVDVWCGKNEDFKALFCRECQIIKAQMYAMNKKATGNGCALTDNNTTTPKESGDGTAEKSSTTK